MQSGPRSNLVVGLLSRFVEAGKFLLRKRAAVNELAHCDALEVARIAQDRYFGCLISAFLPAETKEQLICSIGDWERFGLTRPVSILR